MFYNKKSKRIACTIIVAILILAMLAGIVAAFF